jgi:glucan phosphoethanolaminetransferase (alkaline phosphatase superfamily)
MTSPPDDRDLQALWQSQPPGKDVGSAIALNLIREMAQGFEGRMSRRNRREYIAAAVVVAAFGWQMFTSPSLLLRIGAGMSIAAAIAVTYMIYLWGTARTLPSDLALMSAIEFHRVELERQRDLLRSVWWWYLLPFTPGILVLEIGQALAQPERRSRIIVLSVLMLVLAAGIYWVNWRAAARIQRRIDRLKENQ